jgi:ribonuclease P protein component
MISNKHRFHGHNSLRYVYAHGKTVRSTVLGIRVAENSHRSLYRCAVVVSKKISKSAVRRNRIRRRIYEIIRKNEPIMSLSADIVVTVYSDTVATMPADELETTIIKLLKQAKIIA